MNVQAVFRGGPADGRIMVVRDLRDMLVDQVEPGWMASLDPERGIVEVPRKRYRYEVARILAEFVVGGVS